MREIQVFHDETVDPRPGKYEITLPEYLANESPNVAAGRYVRLQTDDGKTKQVLKVRIVGSGKGDAGYLNDASPFPHAAVVQMQEVDKDSYKQSRFWHSSKTWFLLTAFLVTAISAALTWMMNIHRDASLFGFLVSTGLFLAACLASLISLIQHYFNPD